MTWKIEKNLNDLSESIDNRFKEVDERLTSLELNNESTKESITESVLLEINNRKARENNVIFCNVPESNPEDDLAIVLSLLDSKKNDIDLSNIRAHRLGKLNENNVRPRLLKVRFQDPRNAQWLIFNHKTLNWNCDIKCKSDSTPFQRSLLSKAINELKEREKKGEKNLSIKYIDNIPKCVVLNKDINKTNGNNGNNTRTNKTSGSSKTNFRNQH